MNNSDINKAKLMGGKRKNGHKMDCECHICQNMKNKADRGGYKEEEEKKIESKMGGPKKKNGHKKDCKCPICKNMSKARGKKSSDTDSDSDSSSSSDEEEMDKPVIKNKKRNGHKKDCKCPICKNMSNARGKKSSDSDSDSDSESSSSDEEEMDNFDKRGNIKNNSNKGKKSNGHKANCKCPICKNMSKSNSKNGATRKKNNKKTHKTRKNRKM